MIPTGGHFDRGLGQGQPVELRAGRLVTGAGAKPAGKRLASEIGHRVDTAKEATGLPLHDGGKERVAVLRPPTTKVSGADQSSRENLLTGPNQFEQREQ
jgi:hypothetical protein